MKDLLEELKNKSHVYIVSGMEINIIGKLIEVIHCGPLVFWKIVDIPTGDIYYLSPVKIIAILPVKGK